MISRPTADDWAAKTKGMHNQDDLDDIVERARLGQPIGRSQVIRVEDKNREDFGKITRIENSYVNLGQTTTSGFDLESKLRGTIPAGRLRLRTQISAGAIAQGRVTAHRTPCSWKTAGTTGGSMP